jgi:hypothetical protein
MDNLLTILSFIVGFSFGFFVVGPLLVGVFKKDKK